MKDVDLLIIGCGYAGATIANLAAKDGKKVIIYEKRNHIAGNMYDETDTNGIRIQKYGPHSFHTYNKTVYDFVTSFSKWEEYILTARVDINGLHTPSPFNFTTIEMYFDAQKAAEIENHLKAAYPGQNKTTIVELLNSDDEIIREYANFLFEKDFKPYTSKQWGIDPKELDVSILKRVPVRLDYKDAYFDDPYQVIPSDGFTAVFEEMLNHPNITVKLNEDALEHLSLDEQKRTLIWDNEEMICPVVYTGPIDELLGLKFGRLPYRSLFFDFQQHEIDSFQDCSGVAYPMAEGYTRITEYKKMPIQNIFGKTTVAVEYPVPYLSENGKEPYYPILTDESKKNYGYYESEAKKYRNLFLCGRLAEFKYYNMDNVILRAFEVYEDICKALGW